MPVTNVINENPTNKVGCVATKSDKGQVDATALDSHSSTVMPVVTGRGPEVIEESLWVFKSANESRMTKTLTLTGEGWAKGGAENTTDYFAEKTRFEGLEGLYRLLVKLEHEPTKFLIRGDMAKSIGTGEIITRRHKEKHPDDPTAHIVDVERCTVPVDLDDVPMGEDYDLENTEVMLGKAIKRYLPELFHGAAYVWQLSAGAGIKDGGLLSVHLFFFSDRPVSTIWLRKFMKAHVLDADTSIYKQGQPLYTAAPLIFGGEDPIKQRCGYVGRDKKHLTFPEMDFDELVKIAKTKGIGLVDQARGYEAKMAFLGDGDKLCRFHEVLAQSVASYVSGRLPAEIDVEALVDDCIARVRAAPNDGTPRRLADIRDTYTKRGYLRDNITSAMKSFCLKPSRPRFKALDGDVKAVREASDPMIRETLLQGLQNCLQKGADDRPTVTMMQVGTGIGKTRTALAACVKLKESAKDEWKKLDAQIKPLAEARKVRVENHKILVAELEALKTARGERPCYPMGVDIKEAILAEKIENLAYNPDGQDRKESDLREIRKAVGRVGRVTFSVPTQKLADEVVERARAYGLTAEPWRGRNRRDERWKGEAETPEAFMCHRKELVNEAIALGVPASSICSSNPKVKCPEYDVCGYQLQKHDCQRADIVVVPHAALAHEMPSINVRDTLIIDESFWQTMLDEQTPLGLGTLKRWVGEADDELKDSYLKLYEWALGLNEGPVAVADLVKVLGATEKIITGLKYDGDAAPGVNPKTGQRSGFFAHWGISSIRKALTEGQYDKDVHKKRWLCKQVSKGIFAKGYHTTWVRKDENDALVVRWVNPIRKGWQGKNTLLIDASLDVEINKLFFKGYDIKVTKPLFASAPHVMVTQVSDKPFGIRHFMDAADEPIDSAVHEAWALVRLISLRGSSVTFCQQKLEGEISRLGLGPNGDIAHYNDIRGIDKWKDVKSVISIGRPSPPPLVIESIAEHLTGEPVTTPAKKNGGKGDGFSWFASVNTGLLLADGSGYPVKVDVHPDAMTERVRRQIVDEEVGQAIERGRGVNRTADNPVHYFIFGNTPTRLPVDQVLHWDDVRPGRLERMAASGVMLENATDMALGFPNLWKTARSVRDWRNRAKKQTSVASPIIDILIGEATLVCENPKPTSISQAPSGFISGSYKLNRKYTKTSVFHFHPSLCPDPETWLMERLGPLASFDVHDIDEDEETYCFFELLDAAHHVNVKAPINYPQNEGNTSYASR